VVPVFNEAPNLKTLHARIVSALESFGRTFEIVAVDDGSTDGTAQALDEIRAADHRLRIVRLTRNFGQTPALFAGFAHVRGRIVAMLDADLQNPPDEIPRLITKLEEGFDVVNGRRVNRRDTWFRNVSSRLLNFIVSRVTKVHVQDYGSAPKVFRREVIDRLSRLTHHTRYLLVEAALLGVRIAEVDVRHNERAGGQSKYGLLDLFRVSFDILTGITSAPLQFIGVFGWLFALIGFAMGLFIVTRRIGYGNYNPFATVTAIFFFLVGVQMIATGVMCEYVARIFIEVQNKPYYVVKDVLESEDPE
jgi:undecaprenyl-phosphate 4-deoxy-4-formamido-L-arabinose transferase